MYEYLHPLDRKVTKGSDEVELYRIKGECIYDKSAGCSLTSFTLRMTSFSSVRPQSPLSPIRDLNKSASFQNGRRNDLELITFNGEGMLSASPSPETSA